MMKRLRFGSTSWSLLLKVLNYPTITLDASRKMVYSLETYMDSLDKLKNILSSLEELFLRKDIQEISNTDHLVNDLGIDSLTRVSILFELQEGLNLNIEESEASQWQTVEDILKVIEKSHWKR